MTGMYFTIFSRLYVNCMNKSFKASYTSNPCNHERFHFCSVLNPINDLHGEYLLEMQMIKTF